MWRSSLTRSHLLLSHLRRPAGRSAGGQTIAPAVLGSASPRAYASDAVEVDGAKPWPRPQRHLYVVLDEMNTGRSMYKLNIDDLDGGDEGAVVGMDTSKNRPPHPTTLMPRRLPDPVLRLGFSSIGSCAHFEALGSKIIITGRTRHNCGPLTLVYDTKAARLDIEQPPPDDFSYWHYHAAAAGNKLYTFSSHSSPPHYLCEERAIREYSSPYDSGEERMTYAMRGQINKWVWRKSPSPLPGSSYSDSSFVGSYAVHPNGRTIFVSCRFAGGDSGCFTYTLDTENGKSTRRGSWSLPFNGQAYYDGHLDAWLGIRESDGTDGGKEGYPYLYSCDIPDLADDVQHPQKKRLISAPSWKMCTEELTFVGEDLASQALVHTGRGRFCLVETTPAPLAEVTEDDSRCTCWNGADYLLHVTMFCAKHGKDGELVVSRCRPGRSYLVPHYAADSLSAFWM